MGNFFAELQRRHVYRIGAAYVVVAWLLLQVVNNVAPVLDLPPWIARAILLMLAVGFPIALLLAWIVEPAPQPGGQRAASGGNSRVDWVLVGALAVVIAIFAYQQFAPLPPAASRQAGVEAERAAAASQAGLSIAVLPFENLSGDASQEFFSDGMTEEITAALAKVPDLKVVARTSAFQFKARDRDIQSIGQQLRATHFIEGSVRKEGNRVRITAQLIEAGNGVHVWTESYDRELTGVLAIQENIATAIAGALMMPLGLKQGESLVSNRAIDAESYQQYLRAKALTRLRNLKASTDATALLEQVVARDPDNAPAWALLASSYFLTIQYHPVWRSGAIDEARRVIGASLPKMESAARRAVELDAEGADGYWVLGLAQHVHGDFLSAENFYLKALTLDPNNPDALHEYSALLANVGHLKDALPVRQQLQELEPFVPAFNYNTAMVLALNGQDDAAIAILKPLPPSAGPRAAFLARIYAAQGLYTEASDVLLTTAAGFYLPGTVETAARLLRTAPAKAPSPQSLPPLGRLDFAYIPAGALNRVLDTYEADLRSGYMDVANTSWQWYSPYAPIRKLPRFKTYLREAGYVDYWRAKGWPEFCHPTTGDDFTCE